MICSFQGLTIIAEAGKKILVPLTNSLYVGGTLNDPDHVIVDVGTGFYVEKVGIKTQYVSYEVESR